MNLPEFVRESNMIENITRDPTENEIRCLDDFLQLEGLQVIHIERFVSINQPGAVLRSRVGMDVRVGKHVPPPGSKHMVLALGDLLDRINDGMDPWYTHVEYESLHPFTDGNGRSGRAIWAWQMWHLGLPVNWGFLRTYYYQTLEASRVRVPGG